jgi:hypothetical protein
VDPLAGKFPTQSPFVTFNNSPIVINDITGKSGTPSFANGVITITMNYNFYGNSEKLSKENRDATIAAETAYLQDALNKNPSDAMGPDGVLHPVVFVLTGEYVTYQDALDKARNNVGKNYDPKQNFIRVDDIEEGASTIRTNSTMPVLAFDEYGIPNGSRGVNSLSPDNSIWLSSNNLSTTSSTHEITAHQLGDRSLNSHIDWKDNPDEKIPCMRTTLTTKNAPSQLLTINPKEGVLRLNIALRQVLPADKAKMSLHWEAKKPRMGAGTNTIFDGNGNQIIFNKNRKQITYDTNGKAKNNDN